MALKVTEFDPANPFDGNEIFGFVQSGVNVQGTLQDIASFAKINIQEWAPNWTDDADLYIPANVAMTIDAGNPPVGVGDLAYEKSTTADPSTFASTTLPATLEAGAWLKISATGVSSFLAAHYIRTA